MSWNEPIMPHRRDGSCQQWEACEPLYRINCYQVDAFTDRAFAGNPAAVCVLSAPAEADWMQAVAREMNLSETAFVCLRDEACELRWFTPTTEVDLCGHATLAAAHVLWTERYVAREKPIRFTTRSGTLVAKIRGGKIVLDFPALPAVPAAAPQGLFDALPLEPVFVGRSRYDTLVVVDREDQVRAARPDFMRLQQVEGRGVILTSRSDDPSYDFVSRYFAPQSGINEDPVTGSAHCCLGPYWSPLLARNEMTGYQASNRGGVVYVELQEDRVLLGGDAVTIWTGVLAAGC